MLFGFNSREIWTWYLRPPRSRYEPSVSPWRVFGSLLPHPAAARARTATARDASSRRIGRGSLLRKARGRLSRRGPPRRRQPRNGESVAGFRAPPAIVGRVPRP